MRLAVMHNLWFYNHLMERIRDELDAGTFTAFHDRYVKSARHTNLRFSLETCRISAYNKVI